MITIRLFFGSKARFTNWGLKGCSHGMYSIGGYDYYVYGIAGLMALEIYSGWGGYSKPVHWDYHRKKKQS